MKALFNLKILLMTVFVFNFQFIIINQQSSNLYAQDPELFNHTWYLEKVSTQDEEYILTDYYIAEPSITVFDEQNTLMHSSLCEFMCFFATTSFDSEGNLMNLSEYDECVLTGECIASTPGLFFYKDIYFFVFYFWNSTTQMGVIKNPFTYNIATIDDYLQLTITNSEGDWAVYNSRLLSAQDFNSDSFRLYPNPVKETLYINKIINQIVTVTIYDVSGKQLQHHSFENNLSTINVKALNPGLYFIVFEQEDGVRVSKKFVKK